MAQKYNNKWGFYFIWFYTWVQLEATPIPNSHHANFLAEGAFFYAE